MVCCHWMAEDQSIQLGDWGGGCCDPPADPGQCPGGDNNFLKKVLNIGLRKILEKLTIDTF